MARRPYLRDGSAAILSLTVTMLELAESERQMEEPIVEPRIPEKSMEPVAYATIMDGTLSPS